VRSALRSSGAIPFYISALPSLWGETLISRWLKRRKFVNFSQTDERALVHGDSPQTDLLRVMRNRDGELLELGDDLVWRTDRRELNRVF